MKLCVNKVLWWPGQEVEQHNNTPRSNAIDPHTRRNCHMQMRVLGPKLQRRCACCLPHLSLDTKQIYLYSVISYTYIYVQAAELCVSSLIVQYRKSIYIYLKMQTKIATEICVAHREWRVLKTRDVWSINVSRSHKFRSIF